MKFTKKYYLHIFILLILLGATIRTINYTAVPLHDEYDSVWPGMTLIKNKIPTGWSWMEAYGPRNVSITWTEGTPRESPLIWWKNAGYRLVTPYLDHPPLFSTMMGMYTSWVSTTNPFEVTLRAIRIPMLFLAALTMILLGILAKRWYGTEISLLTVLVYAIIPMIALSNRLVMPENFITPLTLAAILIYEQYRETKKEYFMWIIACFSMIAVLSKVTGLILPATIIAYIFAQKPKEENEEIATGITKHITILIVASILALGIYTAYGYFYNGELFMKLLQEQGSRVFITALFAKIIMEPKLLETFFNDGWILVGIFAFFYNLIKKETRIILPAITMLAVLAFLTSAATFKSWYLIPMYPFIALMIAYFIFTTAKEKAYIVWVVPFAILIPSLYDLITDNVNIWIFRTLVAIGAILYLFYLGDEERYAKLVKYVGITYLTVAALLSMYITLNIQSIFTG